jgi:hypothetical protein
LQPVTLLVLEMVCCVGVLLIPGEKVELPDPPVQVINVEAKAGAVPARMSPAPLSAVTATATVKRFNLNAVTPVSKTKNFLVVCGLHLARRTSVCGSVPAWKSPRCKQVFYPKCCEPVNLHGSANSEFGFGSLENVD